MAEKQTNTETGGGGKKPPPETAVMNGADSDPESDRKKLDEYEHLERELILDDDEADDPGAREEFDKIDLVDRIPKFTRFRTNPATVFDMMGTIDASPDGMDRDVVVVTREFAPVLEDETDLRRLRFYETVSQDGVYRLVYITLPDKNAKKPNAWLVSKRECMEKAMSRWGSMTSRKKLGAYTFKPAAKDPGEPQFTGYTRLELIERVLRKKERLVEDESHPFYRKAAGLDED